MLNEREFAVLNNGHQVIKYNAVQNKWINFLDIPEAQDGDKRCRLGGSMVIDQCNNKMFVLNMMGFDDPYRNPASITSRLFIVDLQSGPILHQSQRDNIGNEDSYDISLVNVNGTIHKMSGTPNNALIHRVWDDNKMIWEQSTLWEIETYSEVIGMSLIHVPSENMIVMIGGFNPVYNQKKNNDEELRHLGIWTYQIETKRWTEINDSFLFGACSAVLTSNEKYIIIDGWGADANLEMCAGTLKVLEVSSGELFDTDVPWKRCDVLYLARTGGNFNRAQISLLVFGWLRKQFSKDEFESFPTVIVGVIEQWCSVSSKEMIHLLKESPIGHQQKLSFLERKMEFQENHTVIALEDILSSMSTIY